MSWIVDVGMSWLIRGKGSSSLKKIAIIGASYLQNPLILKAKEMGYETHVFAWECGDIGERTADHFYPISIVEKDLILEKCKEIGVDGICSIGSDLANTVVSYVASSMGLVSNSVEATRLSTDKHAMRRAFEENGDPSPRSLVVDDAFCLSGSELRFPIIVKPADRSGSRGITKLDSAKGFDEAVKRAEGESFSGIVLVEEFFQGSEYSVEYISWQGEHHFLSITEKFTSGAPMFVEKGHLEPARVDDSVEMKVRSVVEHALDGLGVKYGASHSELKINENGEIAIIEIGSRMGGDRIGSDLVPLSTSYDFVGAVVSIAMGQCPLLPEVEERKYAAIRYVFDDRDLSALDKMKHEAPHLLLESEVSGFGEHAIVDSSSRFGYFMMCGDSLDALSPYLPDHSEEGL